MNLDEMQTVWKAYDRQLQRTRAISEKIIVSMIAERSKARFASVRRQYLVGFGWLLLCLGAGGAVLWGNPFDYTYTWQFAPVALYCIGLIFLLSDMILAFRNLKRIAFHHHALDIALRNVIAVYERPRRFMRYILYGFLFSQIFLFPLSFLPRAIERMGLWTALGERLIAIAVALLLLYVAHRLGAFKERHRDKFKHDLSELESLKAIVAELQEE